MAADQAEVDDDCDGQGDELGRCQRAVVFMNVGINDQGQGQEEKAQDGNDQAVIDTLKKRTEEPKEDDDYSWEGQGENEQKAGHNLPGRRSPRQGVTPTSNTASFQSPGRTNSALHWLRHA